VFVGRLRKGLEQFNETHREFGAGTVSVGLAESPRDGDSVPALLGAADAALYAAKGAGRNLVRAAGEA
jgi:PleD family two-component response regulator